MPGAPFSDDRRVGRARSGWVDLGLDAGALRSADMPLPCARGSAATSAAESLSETLRSFFDAVSSFVDIHLRRVDADYERAERAALLCEHCEVGAPHHTVGEEGIGDARRRTVRDLHEVADASGVGLAECTAYDAVWKALER